MDIDGLGIKLIEQYSGWDSQKMIDQFKEAIAAKPDGIVIAEHFKKQASPAAAGSLALYREAKYGDTVLAFYKETN